MSLTGWDNRSVDPAPTDVTGGTDGPRAVARYKVDLNWMTTPARAAVCGPGLQFGKPATVTTR